MSAASPAPTSPPLALLGPQRLQPCLDQACADLDIAGPIAVITAGWEEREAEDDELVSALGGRSATNLRLYDRAERLFAAHPELLDDHRARRDRRAALRRFHRLRLAHALDAVRELHDRRTRVRATQREAFDLACADAVRAVQQLDAEHLGHTIDAIHDPARPPVATAHPAVAAERDAIDAILRDCTAVAIAGGNVRIILDVLMLFALAPRLRDRPIVAWSAGAMALGERIVLFHDSPPQGPGNAEIHAPGLDFHRGLVLLPHAKRRLRLDDADRVALFARRFAPAACLALDDGAALIVRDDRVVRADGVQQLRDDGSVVPFTTAELES